MAAAGLCGVDDTGLSNRMVGVTSFAGGAFLWSLHAAWLSAEMVGERSVKIKKACGGQFLAGQAGRNRFAALFPAVLTSAIPEQKS